MNKKQGQKNRRTARQLLLRNPPKNQCPNCGEYTHHGHFAPPCFGEEGFYMCDRDVQLTATKKFIFDMGEHSRVTAS